MTLRSTPDTTPRGIRCTCAHRPVLTHPEACQVCVHVTGCIRGARSHSPDDDSGEGPPWDPILRESQRKPRSLKAMKAGRGAQREDAKQPAVAGS